MATFESSILKVLTELESPLPYLREARDAASKLVTARRDLFVLESELSAIRQVKRMGFGVATVLTLNLTLILFFFWLTTSLHERGWKSGSLALGCLAVFGALTAILAWIAVRVGRRLPEETPE